MILHIKESKKDLYVITLDVYNWRLLYDYPESDEIGFVTDNFTFMRISNFSIDKFNEINSLPKSELNVKGRFIGNSLKCIKCAGEGITDWVSCIMPDKTTNLPYSPPPKKDYKRDLNKPVYKVVNSSPLSEEFTTAYISQQVLPEAMMYCPQCLGTGLHVTKLLINRYGSTFHKFERC